MVAEQPVVDRVSELLETFRRRLVEHEADFEFGISLHAFEGEFGREDGVTMALDGDQERARVALVETMLEDLRFEHLKKSAADKLSWDFAYACEQPAEDVDPAGLIWDSAAEPEDRTCWFWIPGMTVPGPMEFSGVAITSVQEHSPPDRFAKRVEGGAVIGVPCHGTNPSNMRDRARQIAEIALQRLRIALDEEYWILPQHLMFEISEFHWFDTGGTGFRRDARLAIPVEIEPAQVTRFEQQPLLQLPVVPTSEIEEQIAIAVGWVDRASFSADPVVATLFRFFALEALFTKRRESMGLKRIIARRCATLSREVESGYMNPLPMPHLYDQVRSQAVHGEEPHQLSEKSAKFVKGLTAKALSEYMTFASANGFQHRWEVLNALDNSEHRTLLIEGLKRHDPKTWENKGE